MAMSRFLLTKAGAALIVVFLASVLVFVGVRAIPGDRATALAGEEGDPVALEAIRHEYLLDRPLPVQYARWISRVVQGDLGVDRSRIPIGHTIFDPCALGGAADDPATIVGCRR